MKYLVGLVTVKVVVVSTWCPLTVTAQPLDLHIFPWLPGPSPGPWPGPWTRPPPDLFSPLVTSTGTHSTSLDAHTYYT